MGLSRGRLRSRAATNKSLHRNILSTVLALIMMLTMLPTPPALADVAEADSSVNNVVEFRMAESLVNNFSTGLLAIRKSGDSLTEWMVADPITNSGTRSFTIAGLQNDLTYDYVFKYCATGYEYSCKGTLSFDSASDTWSFTGLLAPSVTETSKETLADGSMAVVTLRQAFSTGNNAIRQRYPQPGTQFRTNAGPTPLLYLEMFDNDETPICHSAVTTGGFVYYYVPNANSGGTTYPLDRSCDYILEAPGFQPAKGKFYRTDTATSGSSLGSMVPANTDHSITYSGNSYIIFNLAAAEVSVSISGLFEGTQLIPINDLDGICSISSDNNKITFDLGGAASADVQVDVVNPGFATVPLQFHIEGSLVTLVNEVDMSAYTAKTTTVAKQFSYNASSGTMTLPQLPLFTPTYVPELGLYRTTTTNLGAYISHNMSYGPGTMAWCDFDILNDTGKKLDLVDYSFSPTDEGISNNLLRLDSPALRGYCDAKGISITGNKSYIFDFESLAGESFSDAMLWYFKNVRGFSTITALEHVPAEVIASELLGGAFDFDGNTWGGSSTASYALASGNNSYSIKETDQDIWALAQWLLYDYALSLTFDRSDTDVVRSGNLNALTPAQRATLYPAYCEKTPGNAEMMDRILSNWSIVEDGETIRFNNTAFALNGDYIHDAYRGTKYEFDFSFDLYFAEVGVSGIAFLDKNANNVLDHPDEDDSASRFSGLTVELYQNGSPTGISTVTDAYGYYHFADVAEADGYEVHIQIPSEYTVCPTTVDSLNGNFFRPGGHTDAFSVTPDKQSYWLNAGFVAVADPDPNPDPDDPEPLPVPDPGPVPGPGPDPGLIDPLTPSEVTQNLGLDAQGKPLLANLSPTGDRGNLVVCTVGLTGALAGLGALLAYQRRKWDQAIFEK